MAGAGERAGEEEDGEREEDGEQAGEGGAALAALELCAGDVDAEAVARHDADHSWSAELCEEPFYFLKLRDAKSHFEIAILKLRF